MAQGYHGFDRRFLKSDGIKMGNGSPPTNAPTMPTAEPPELRSSHLGRAVHTLARKIVIEHLFISSSHLPLFKPKTDAASERFGSNPYPANRVILIFVASLSGPEPTPLAGCRILSRERQIFLSCFLYLLPLRSRICTQAGTLSLRKTQGILAVSRPRQSFIYIQSINTGEDFR